MSNSNKKKQEGKKAARGGGVKGKRSQSALQIEKATPLDSVSDTLNTGYSSSSAKKKYQDSSPTRSIGEMAETSLHAAMKNYLAKPGDRYEVKIEGKIVDLLRANGEIVEVQTGNFGKLKQKIEKLSPLHPIRVVFPIPSKRIIVQLDKESGSEVSRRKSPKQGSVYSLFEELIYFPALLSYPGVSLEVFLVEIEELRVKDGKGSWRRRFQSILDRRLSHHENSRTFSETRDLLDLLPPELHSGFTTSLLARTTGISLPIAGKMAYVLKKTGLTREDGRQGREKFYRVRSKAKKGKTAANRNVPGD